MGSRRPGTDPFQRLATTESVPYWPTMLTATSAPPNVVLPVNALPSVLTKVATRSPGEGVRAERDPDGVSPSSLVSATIR